MEEAGHGSVLVSNKPSISREPWIICTISNPLRLGGLTAAGRGRKSFQRSAISSRRSAISSQPQPQSAWPSADRSGTVREQPCHEPSTAPRKTPCGADAPIRAHRAPATPRSVHRPKAGRGRPARTGASAPRCVLILFGGPPRAMAHSLTVAALYALLSRAQRAPPEGTPRGHPQRAPPEGTPRGHPHRAPPEDKPSGSVWHGYFLTTADP